MRTKRLTDADLGLSSPSHQTHIGLLSEMVSDVSKTDKTYEAYLYLGEENEWLPCYASIKSITRESGAVEAPRLKTCSAKINDDEDLYKLIRKYGTQEIRYLTLGTLPDKKIIAILHKEVPVRAPNASVQILSSIKEEPPSDGASVFGNIIYFGPPGTGKSTKIDDLIKGRVALRTQFHPEYSHSDFVGCYRPVVGSHTDPSKNMKSHEGNLTAGPVNYFSFVPGPFIEAIIQAFKSPDRIYLIIEEINRGNCAAIFGEVFQLLDRDESGKSKFSINPKPEITEYFQKKGISEFFKNGAKLEIPGNMTILATMNTSDQSLFPMDSAFKRRWQWISCPIDYSELLKYTKNTTPFIEDAFKVYNWIKILENINSLILKDSMEDKQLGPWFIKPDFSGRVSFDEFLNKVLFYLWHDVFKDEQTTSEFSPFKTDLPSNFATIQQKIRDGGLEAGLKTEVLAGAA